MNRSKKKSFDWYGVRQRFSIRKYHIGAASVLLGTTLVLGTGTIVSAETGVNGDGDSNGQIVPGNNDGISDGTTNPTVDEPIIKFPTQDNQAQPAGYQKVEFQPANGLSDLSFENKPGEIQNGNFKTVVFWVKTGTTWGALMSDPQFRIPKYTVADGDFILSYASNVGQVAYPIDFDALKDTPIVDRWQINTIVDYIIGDVTDGKTFEEYMNSGAYKPFQIPQFHGITLDANGGTVGGKAKKAFYVAYQHVQWGDQRVTSKIVDPSRDGYTFVRWQTATGEGIPTSGQIDTIEFTAVWLEHPTDKVAVFDRTNLTDSEKEQVKKKIYDANPDLSTGVAQVIKAIEISDTGEATVTFDDDKVVTVSSTTLINEDQDTARSNAKAEIEQEATEKSDAINASALTEEEKRAKLAEVDNKKAAADSAIDRANTSDELNTALEAGKSAIAGIDTSTSAKKTQAKQDLETAYNAKQNEIANSSLTRGEKEAKQAELDQAKSVADSAIDAATTDSAVESALTNGKAAIESTYTAIIKIPSSASETAPQGYVTVSFNGNDFTQGFTLGIQTGTSSVKVFVKNDVTWGTLLKDPAWQWPTVKTAPGDTVVGWAMNIYYGQSYNPNNAFAREKYKDTVVTNTKLYPNVVYEVEEVGSRTKEQYLALYGPDEQDKWIFIKFDAGQGSMTYENRQYTSRSVAAYFQGIGYDNSQFTSKVVSPTLANHTFVRWQTDAGEVLPKSGEITTDTTYKALYLAHPQNKVAVFDSANLTTSEKEQVKKNILDANPDLSTGVAPAIKAIDISDTGEATVTFDDTVVTVSSATLTNEDQDTARSNAKAEIEKVATEKSDAINASNLTEEEKREKLDEVNNAKAAADSAIDQANTSDELNQALNNGKTEIGNVPVTSQGKAAALAELQSAKEAKLQAIENSNLTDEEKSAATQAVNTAYDTAVNNINNATTNDALTEALNTGKAEIGNVPVTSQGKAAALAELQSAKE
uniref:DUF1542 domain-containing protein n=1 Tax=Streptococcus suis TaxID=1307 RepID=UPI00115620E4